MTPESAAELGRLDAEAIDRVREEAWPNPSNVDELHDALMVMGCWTAAEGRGEALVPGEALNRQRLMDEFDSRGSRHGGGRASGKRLWVTAERVALWLAIHPEAACEPPLAWESGETAMNRGDAIREAVRGRLEGLGPVTFRVIGRIVGFASR